MQRRRLLALSLAFAAGCSSQQDDTGTSAATEEATPGATATQTETARTTETAAETATPTEAEREGDEAIAEVQNTLDAIVRQFGGKESDDIREMDAAGDFSSLLIDRNLTEADEELDTARELAVTEQQRETVDRLVVAHRFMTLATEVQSRLVSSYFSLTRARQFLDEEEAAEARDGIEGAERERGFGVPAFQRIVEETDAESVAVVPRLPPAVYQGKVEQFDAELAAFRRIQSPIGRFIDGVNILDSARVQDRTGSERATETAQRAVSTLEEAVAALSAFAANLSEAADSLAPLTDDLIQLARTKTEAARTLAGEN